jgi:hypothetical protein
VRFRCTSYALDDHREFVTEHAPLNAFAVQPTNACHAEDRTIRLFSVEQKSSLFLEVR